MAPLPAPTFGLIQLHNLPASGRFKPGEDDLQVDQGFFGGEAKGAAGCGGVVKVEPFFADAVAALLDWDGLGWFVSACAPNFDVVVEEDQRALAPVNLRVAGVIVYLAVAKCHLAYHAVSEPELQEQGVILRA